MARTPAVKPASSSDERPAVDARAHPRRAGPGPGRAHGREAGAHRRAVEGQHHGPEAGGVERGDVVGDVDEPGEQPVADHGERLGVDDHAPASLDDSGRIYDPTMSADLTDEHEAFRKVVRDFVETEIAPHAEAWDRDHTSRSTTVQAMGELGLFGIPFPEEYGGGGGDLTTLCVAIEEIARVDQSLAITLEAGVGPRRQPRSSSSAPRSRPALAARPVAGRTLGGFGLTEPDAGSDAGGTRTKAVLDEGGRVGDRRREGVHHELGHVDHVDRHRHGGHRSGGGKPEISTIVVPGRHARASRCSRRTARWAGTPRTPTA